MSNSVLQTIGCTIGCVGGICNLIALFLPQWKTSDSPDLDAISRFEGEPAINYQKFDDMPN